MRDASATMRAILKQGLCNVKKLVILNIEIKKNLVRLFLYVNETQVESLINFKRYV